MTNFRKQLVIWLLALTVTPAAAQQENSGNNGRTATEPERSLTVGIGSTAILDTYMSQEEYTGTELRIISHSDRRMKRHPAWHRSFTHSGQFAMASPRADNADYLYGLYTIDYALRHEWRLSERWAIEAGGQVEGGVGFAYSTRNSNNPAQARIYLNIGPTAMATYRFPLFRRQMQLHYEVAAPLAGLLFSPNYGQSYYEIFSRGDYDHNIVPTTPFCAPTLRHSLTLDIPFRRQALRIGYLGDCQQARVNSLKYHTYSHLFIIGYVKNL